MITFRLIHYTEGWQTGREVNLSALPQAGMLLKADEPESIDLGSGLYYVDNVMLGDGGDNYLFVRPYEGYGTSSPLTELDRLDATVRELSEAVDNLCDNIMERLG